MCPRGWLCAGVSLCVVVCDCSRTCAIAQQACGSVWQRRRCSACKCLYACTHTHEYTHTYSHTRAHTHIHSQPHAHTRVHTYRRTRTAPPRSPRTQSTKRPPADAAKAGRGAESVTSVTSVVCQLHCRASVTGQLQVSCGSPAKRTAPRVSSQVPTRCRLVKTRPSAPGAADATSGTRQAHVRYTSVTR